MGILEDSVDASTLGASSCERVAGYKVRRPVWIILGLHQPPSGKPHHKRTRAHALRCQAERTA